MDAVLGLLQNPLALVVFGLLVKYVPALAKIPNAGIPFLNALLAFLGQVAGPQPAHAGAFGPIAAFGFLSFLGPVGGAVWQSVQASLLHEFFLRHPLAAAGFKKAVA